MKPVPPELDAMLTPAEAAEWLRLSERVLLNKPGIPSIRINARVIRYHPRTVLAKLAEDSGLSRELVASMFGKALTILLIMQSMTALAGDVSMGRVASSWRAPGSRGSALHAPGSISDRSPRTRNSVKLVSHAPVHGSVSMTIPNRQTQPSKARRSAGRPLIPALSASAATTQTDREPHEVAPMREASLRRTMIGRVPFQLERWLDAVAAVESNSDHAIGDNGRAVGRFQMHAAAVAMVNARTGWRWQHRDMIRPDVARSYARIYALILSELLAAGGCTVSPSNLWAAWNVGHHRFRARGFLVSNCPPSTQQAARFITQHTYGN